MVIWTQLTYFYSISTELISLSKITIMQQFVIKLFSFTTFLLKTFQVIHNITSVYPIRTKSYVFLIPSSYISRQEGAVADTATDWAQNEKKNPIQTLFATPVCEGMVCIIFLNYNKSAFLLKNAFSVKLKLIQYQDPTPLGSHRLRPWVFPDADILLTG